MTIEVSAHYKQQWKDGVTLRLQGRGFQLKGTVMPPVKIEGEKIYFLRSGTLNTTPWGGKGHAVVRQNSSDDKIEVTSSEWDSAYELYDRDKWMGVPAEEQTRQKQAANAIGTRADSIIYEKIMAAAIPPGNIIGDYTKGLDPYMLKQAEAILYNNFTPMDGGIYLPIPSTQFQRLTTYKVFQNSEWVGVTDNPRIKVSQGRTYGEINCFQGEKDLFTPYITNAGANLRVRVWHKECVGAGHIAPSEMRAEWKREGDYKRWLVMHTLDGGAEVIEPNGIVEFRLLATAAIEDEIIRTKAVA